MAIKVFVDQGHNPYGHNTGAEGFGLKEQDITYVVGSYLANLLANDPRFLVAVSRQTPDDVLGYNNTSSLRERVDMANAFGADYFISVHVNANENPAINGTESYVYATGTPAYDLGLEIVKEITRRVGTKDNGTRVNSSLYVLRRTNMPAVLVELAYITNYDDALLLESDQYQFAYGIYVGLLNYLNLPTL